MNKWQKCDGGFLFVDQATGIKIKLYDDKGSLGLAESLHSINLKQKCKIESFEISDICIPEWTEIWVQIENAEISELYFGRQLTEKHQNEWRFTFRNYLGKSQIRLQLEDGQELTSDGIEVISPKTLDEKSRIFYPKLLKTLVQDLVRYLVTLPFDWSAPTEFPTEEKVQPPSPIFVLQILSQKADEIRSSLQTILCSPYRTLVTEERWVRLDESTSIDADTILMMIQHPEHLRRYCGKGLLTFANRFKGPGGKKFVPERVFERRVTETFDTPENRFIKHFVDTVLFLCDELERKGYWQRAVSYSRIKEIWWC